jgi:outer membrane receptor protein involved in Fe transport
LQNIKPQTADQYEVGLKTSKKLYDLYLTGFYNRFHNLVFQDIRVINGVEQNVVQFGGSRAYGVEFEGALRPIEGLQLAARGVWQNGKFQDFGTNSGHQVNRQPQFQVAFTPSYTQRTAWVRRGFSAPSPISATVLPILRTSSRWAATTRWIWAPRWM